MTFFLTTHYMEETEEADRICIIDDGRIIADDTPARLRARHSRSVLTVTTDDAEAVIEAARAVGASPVADNGTLVIEVPAANVARGLPAAHGHRHRTEARRAG